MRQYKKNELPFQIYDVLAIIGTEDPEIDDILYIGLEELITGDEVEKLVRLVEHEVEIDAMKLRDDLIFNFSLKKMIENLVILDVEKVLALVKAAIERLEKILDRSFNSNRRFLLYLHCCCMVERILRKENIDPQEDIKKYKQMYQSQMAAIKQAFQEVERAYTIELSDLEVRLIHEIISNKGE
ncbi:PRD domain-containing protein [Enterococcus durans]|uniref:PRD domain-containing protein n=1 Tax=Enterococcus durans TaxID=53345 RepID=UPI002892AEE8|nr:PRD domain-containing protein [Enterococcus durans]